MTKSYFQYFSLVILLFVFTSACKPPPTQPPLPIPQTLSVSYTPALSPLLNALSTCALQQPEIALIVNEVSAPYLDIHKSDFSLRIGFPQGSTAFSAVLAVEKIVLITHPSNPVEILSVEDVTNIFSGVTTNWLELDGDDFEIDLWIYYTDEDIQQVIQKAIMDNLSPTLKANLAPDPGAMLTTVANNPSAIGYLPQSWLSDDVKPITISSDTNEFLTQPVLALSNEEPKGQAREYLFCLQNGIGHEIINDIYD
jgi:hypothetical protein